MNPSPEREARALSEYGHLWASTASKADELLDSGEAELNRLVLLMRRDFGEEFSDPILKKKNQERDVERKKTGFIFDRQHIRVNGVEARTATLMLEALKMRTLVDLCAGAERIVELGAGWGKNLFKLWLYGASRDAEYHAMELTPEGRALATRVAQKAAPNMKFFAQPFDYYRPDFSMFADDRPTVVFTHHSIEQIPQIGDYLLEAVRKIPGFIRSVHMEPVGFQVPGNSWLEASLETMTGIDERNRSFAEKRDQNRNLYPLLRSMELAGTIRLPIVRKHFCSILLKNATTLLVWEDPRTPELSDTSMKAERDDLQPLRTESAWKALRSKLARKVLGNTAEPGPEIYAH